MKWIILAALLIAANANAGLVTGAVTGAVVGYVAGSGSKNTSQSQAIMSDSHSVIACRTMDGVMCFGFLKDISPNQFAGNAGYRVIYKKGVSFNDDKQFIILEVGK